MVDVLHATYMDKTNYVYLTFLKSILSDVQVAVKSFEGEQTDPVKLLDNLVHFLTSICSRVVNHMAKMDVLKDAIDGHLSPSAYRGYLLESTVYQLSLAPEDKKVIRRECINYIVAFRQGAASKAPRHPRSLARHGLVQC